MGIEYYVDNENFCPVIFCDECDTDIKDARLAMAAWHERLDQEMEGKRFIPVFVHKVRCLPAFEAGMPKVGLLMTIELSDFLQFLTNNADIEGRKRRK